MPPGLNTVKSISQLARQSFNPLQQLLNSRTALQRCSRAPLPAPSRKLRETTRLRCCLSKFQQVKVGERQSASSEPPPSHRDSPSCVHRPRVVLTPLALSSGGSDQSSRPAQCADVSASSASSTTGFLRSSSARFTMIVNRRKPNPKIPIATLTSIALGV